MHDRPGDRGAGWWLAGRSGSPGALLLRSLGSTWRIRVVGAERDLPARAEPRAGIYAFWHGKLLPLAYTHRNLGVVVLVSRNRDGEIITRIIEKMGYLTVRGSSTRGGLRAVVRMAARGREGNSLAVTPDGPRGPFETLQPGLFLIAQKSGLPVVPLGVAAQPSTRLSSWDGFLVPHPFARCVLSVGRPFRVPSGVAPADLAHDLAAEVAAYLKANDDHAARQLIQWASGGTEPTTPFDGPLPRGVQPEDVEPAHHRGDHGAAL